MLAWYDREKLEKIVTNLLSNAFKYTPDDWYHHLSCENPECTILCSGDPQIRIMVADTGPGIPEKERLTIFERFYRSGQHLHEDAGGTGIGLSLTRELVTLMKGEIAIKSTPVGRGCLHCHDTSGQKSPQ